MFGIGPLSISVKAQYALRALFDLTLHQSGTQPVKIAAIAQRQNIPQKFLELILASLRQGGFVESRRGAEGGYLLARPADQITVGQVLRYVEGSRVYRDRHRTSADDPFSSLWARVEQAVSQVLDRTTLAELAREWNEKQNRYVPYWEI